MTFLDTFRDLPGARAATILLHRANALIDALFVAHAVRRQRNDLLGLDERALKDIGISAADAWREGHRDFLDLPRKDRNPDLWG
jgi:uncharacterized protein YjiS (DUF1127 family)